MGLKQNDNRISRLLAAEMSDAERVEELFLVALSRMPTDAERESVQDAIKEVPADSIEQRRLVFEDIFWSLMSTREFLFNH